MVESDLTRDTLVAQPVIIMKLTAKARINNTLLTMFPPFGGNLKLILVKPCMAEKIANLPWNKNHKIRIMKLVCEIRNFYIESLVPNKGICLFLTKFNDMRKEAI
jgi:hypothetical protein